MNVFKKIILSILIILGTNSIVLGMENAELDFGVFKQVLHDAISAGQTDRIMKLLGAIDNIRYKEHDLKAYFVMSPDESGRTTLHCAAMQNNPEIAEILLKAVHDKKQRAEFLAAAYGFNITALDIAVKNGNSKIVKILLKAMQDLWFTAKNIQAMYVNALSTIVLCMRIAKSRANHEQNIASASDYLAVANELLVYYELFKTQIPQEVILDLKALNLLQ